jgi:hypothetical protein
MECTTLELKYLITFLTRLPNEKKLFRNALKEFLFSNFLFIIVKNILITTANLVKTGRKL